MRIALIIIGVLAVIVAVIIAIGAMLPKKHVASRSMQFSKSADVVFNTIRDVESYPKWRADVKRIELLGTTRFREYGAHDAITYDIIEDVPPHKLVTRIADTNLGYSGSWTYEITPTANGAELRITEKGEVTNPLFRFLSRFVFGHTATMDRYLASLGTRLAS